jgi:hypothetical protein
MTEMKRARAWPEFRCSQWFQFHESSLPIRSDIYPPDHDLKKSDTMTKGMFLWRNVYQRKKKSLEWKNPWAVSFRSSLLSKIDVSQSQLNLEWVMVISTCIVNQKRVLCAGHFSAWIISSNGTIRYNISIPLWWQQGSFAFHINDQMG